MNESPPETQAQKTASPRTPDPRGVARFIASLGGIGYARFMPGTWGSLVAAPPLIAVAFVFGYLWLLGVAVVLTLGGVVLLEPLRRAEKANAQVPEQDEKWDPPWVVLDEAAGMAVALVPFALHGSPLAIVFAFVLFRLLDATKPPPVRQAEGLPGAFGVMADDLVAGLGAAILTAAALFFIQALKI